MGNKKFLLFGVLFMFAMLLTTSVSAFSFEYCTPDPCPSGYYTYASGCDLAYDGVSYDCTRYCKKEIDAHCDDNWDWGYDSNKKTVSISGRQNTISVDTDLQSSDKCYKYYAEARVGVDDWKLGTFCSRADSFKVDLTTPNGRDTWACSRDWYQGVSSIEWTDEERGSSYGTRIASAEITAYKDSYCNDVFFDSSCGVKDNEAEIQIKWKTADWIPEQTKKTRETCSGQFECANGDTRCDNYMQQECVDHNWEDRGIEIGECGVECKQDSDCSSDTFVGNKYCKDGDLVQDYKDYSCSNYDCSSKTTTKAQEVCEYGCSNSQCESLPEPGEPEVSPISKFINNLWDWMKGLF